MRVAIRCEARRYGALLVAAVLATGCRAHGPLSSEEAGGIQNWLTCDECINGEREEARRIGGRAIGKLDSALVGPSPQRMALMRAKLGDSFRFAHSPGSDSDAYINPRLANFVATYQKRAAMSLGDIGNGSARDALDRAIGDSTARQYRPDVMRTIRVVRTGLGAPSFGGRISPAQLPFGEIMSVTAPPGRHFAPQDHAEIADSPFPPDQIPFVRVGDTLRFFAVADAGSHAVVVTDPRHKGGTAVGSVTITSLLDATDRATLNCSPSDLNCAVANAPHLLDTVPASGGASPRCRAGAPGCVVHLPRLMAGVPGRSSVPFAIFLALSRTQPRPDTLDFVKIEPPVNLPLTALLDWRGPANLDLAWRRCSPFVPVGSSAGATLAATESTSVVVPARDCWILQVSMGPGGNGPAFARLRIRSP